MEKSDAELLANFQEDRFNKFETHEACWDLNKRGGVGETPFHLCYLMDTPVHFEVGKALMEVFPKLALDVYEGEEYFGKCVYYCVSVCVCVCVCLCVCVYIVYIYIKMT